LRHQAGGEEGEKKLVCYFAALLFFFYLFKFPIFLKIIFYYFSDMFLFQEILKKYK